MPVSSNFSAGVQLVNGWNNVEDNNAGKTVGFTTALTTSKINWFNIYYVGNEKTDTVGGVQVRAPGIRHFYDTVIGINPNGKVSGLFNFDIGTDKNPDGRNNNFYGYSIAMRALGGRALRPQSAIRLVQRSGRIHHDGPSDHERVHDHRRLQVGGGVPQPLRISSRLVKPAVL